VQETIEQSSAIRDQIQSDVVYVVSDYVCLRIVSDYIRGF